MSNPAAVPATDLQLIDAEKKVITAMLREITDLETVHKIWCICNRYAAKQKRAARKGGAEA